MEIDQLRTYLAVVELGSFSRAAEKLGLAQSTVSFQMKALETAAGARLFDRRGGKAVPTPAGKLLRRDAQRLLGLHDEALRRLRAEEDGSAGSITVAASTIPAEYLLPPVLAVLRARYPAVSLRIETSDSAGALSALLAQECDIAVVGSSVRDRRVATGVFADDEVLCVGVKSLVPRRRLRAADLSELPLVLRHVGSGTREAVEPLLVRAGSGRPLLEVGSTEAARRCVLAGLGLGFLSRHAVADDLARGTLVSVELAGTPVRRRFHAARLRRVTPPAAAVRLWGLLVRKHR
jgi:DNA-binding transcriptional LysR family regulator